MIGSDRSGGEAVPRPSYGLYEPIVPEFFERFTQTSNMHVDGTFFHVNVAAPDSIQQLIPSVDALGMGHEELEHAVLGRAQRNGPIGDHDPVTGLIQCQTLELDQLVSPISRRATQHGVDPGQQLTRREGLRHVIVRTALEAGYLVTLFRAQST